MGGSLTTIPREFSISRIHLGYGLFSMLFETLYSYIIYPNSHRTYQSSLMSISMMYPSENASKSISTKSLHTSTITKSSYHPISHLCWSSDVRVDVDTILLIMLHIVSSGWMCSTRWFFWILCMSNTHLLLSVRYIAFAYNSSRCINLPCPLGQKMKSLYWWASYSKCVVRLVERKVQAT